MSDATDAGHGGRARLRSGHALRSASSLALTALLFLVDPDNFYLWVKAIHVIAVISWMAGMLYLPRLFVYHAECRPGSPQSETFKVMERRLLRAIINPAMIVTWVFGLWLAWKGFGFSGRLAACQDRRWCLCCRPCTAIWPARCGDLPRTATKSRRGTGASSTRSPHC